MKLLLQLALVTGTVILVEGDNDWEIPDHQVNKLTAAIRNPVDKLMNFDWKNRAQEINKVTSAIREQVTNLKDVDWASPRQQITKMATAIRQPLKTFNELIFEEVRTADIRLLRKDPKRPIETHPLLEAANIDQGQAKSIFETGWIDFYTWVSDLDTEYEPLYEAEKLFFNDHYNKGLDTIVILHDRCGNAKDHEVLKIIEALKMRNYDANYNIFILDFKKFMCKKMAPDGGLLKIGFNPQVTVLSEAIGNFLYKGIQQHKIRAKQINILGLGVSTHLAAYVSRHVKRVSRRKINSILGLDPPVSLRRSLFNKEFTRYTHIYHTFKLLPGLDPTTGRATADFVFGGAKRGPQCRKSTITITCFKGFGVQLFLATLLYPNLFAGRWCPSYSKFSEKFCDGNDYTYVAFPPNKKAQGIYHMDISYEFPYGRGLEGINEEEEEVSADSIELSKMSIPEYYHHLEVAVSHIRSELMTCINGVPTRKAVSRCLMTARPSVQKLVKQKLINKTSCEPYYKSPTGKRCHYETRTNNKFDLPF
ncbi:uncharacterized protein LOC128992046 [Macrosteles quadrilineatus]|uniref:uncharacterized protein LOC128992046 n=1 Tax=Macrosteles quadrilineatus TaxID=74068 RepID=UPI0023E121C7|nr:uncharacterized protein LOC128992046 [Macrosteles quadrilineatus]